MRVKILRNLASISACFMAGWLYWHISYDDVQKQIGSKAGSDESRSYWSKIDDISLVSYLGYDSPVRISARQIQHDGDIITVFEPVFKLEKVLEFDSSTAKFQRLENLLIFDGTIRGKYQEQYIINASDIKVELNKKFITSNKHLEIYNQHQFLTSSAGFNFPYDKKIMYLNGEVNLRLKNENASIKSANAQYMHDKNQAIFINAKLIAENDVVLTAGQMMVEDNNNFSASGQVHFTNKEYNITSDQAHYDRMSGLITMRNNISIIRHGSKVKGKEFTFDLKKKQARMHNGSERVKATISE